MRTSCSSSMTIAAFTKARPWRRWRLRSSRWLCGLPSMAPSSNRIVIFASLLIPVGTEARTGLLCIAALAVLLLRDVKRRMTFLVAGAALGVAALPFLPQSYYDRMATIAQPGGDESASTRLAVWEWTLDYAQRNPLGGGFDAYRGNSFTYEMPVKEEVGNTTSVEYREVTDEGRAYHSAVFELLGEQGYPGLVIWMLLHGLGIWQMEKIRSRWRGRTAEGETWQAPMAQALQIAGIIYFVGALPARLQSKASIAVAAG